MRVSGTLALVFLSLFPVTAQAYNFLYINPTNSKPIGWEPGTTIHYYLDPGPLGRLTNDQAHTLLKEAMKIWENASPYADVPHFEFAGYLPEDVDGGNYQKYVSGGSCYADDLNSCPTEAQKNLQTVIIFDEDSSILNNVICRIGTGCSAHGAASVFSGSTQEPGDIVAGALILGKGAGSDNEKIAAVVGTMVHELGHVLGLAHSSVNQQAYLDDLTGYGRYMPTMFFSYVPLASANTDQALVTLNPDDIAGIIDLYPKSTAVTELGTIKGQILKSDGSPMMHVNVIARNVEDPLCEAYSFLSGRICPEGLTGAFISSDYCQNSEGLEEKTGNFRLSGLSAGSYSIEVEEVADDSLALTLSPGLLPSEDIYGDAEFWNEGDTVNEANTLASEIELAAGETRENIDIVLDRSEVTEDRIKYLSLEDFSSGAGSDCPQDPRLDYAALIGINEVDGSDIGNSNSTGTNANSIPGGCALTPNF